MTRFLALLMTLLLVLLIISCVFEYPHRSPFTYNAIMDAMTRIEQPPTLFSSLDSGITPSEFGDIKPILDKIFGLFVDAGYLISYPIRLVVWGIDTIGTFFRVSGLQNVYNYVFGGWN